MILTQAQKINLSEEQRELVYHKEGEGSLLVVAAAGSGKTRILTERVNYLLTKKEVFFSVLCLTFTKKAAEEMKERLKNVPNIEERTFIGTIHDFALQFIISRRQALGFVEVPHIIEREQDRRKVVEQIVVENPILCNAYKNKDAKTQYTFIGELLNTISHIKKNLNQTETDDQESFDILNEYNQILRAQNMIDYDDILLLAYQLFSRSKADARLYQRLYKYILIDEAQDLSFAQYHLLKALCGENHKNVFMVGDPNQAIHSYAEASTKYMLHDFIADFEADKKAITKNFRSSKKVIELANKIMLNGSRAEDAHYVGIAEVQAFADETQEAEWIANKIKSLIINEINNEEIEGTISFDKIAVLARNRFVFSNLENVLKEDDFFKNKYFVKKSIEGLELETDIIKVFDLGTRIVSNSFNQLHFQEILKLLKLKDNQPINSKNNIDKLNSLLSLVSEEYTHKSFIINSLVNAWQMLQNEKSMFDVLKYLFDQINKNIEIEENEKALILEDIKYYENTWRDFLIDTNSNTKNLVNFRQFIAIGITNNHKNKGLTLATIHTIKGLQYDIVFVMGMNDGTFPDYRAKTEQAIREEKNVAYVAVTRAKRWVYLTYPLSKKMPWGDNKPQQKSRFIV